MQDFIFSNDFSRNIDAMIYTCGYENCEPGHSYGPLLRNGYMVHYILSGKGVYQCRGRTFHLGEGEAFLICPGELIYYLADKFPNRRPAGAEKRSNYVEEALLLEYMEKYDKDGKALTEHLTEYAVKSGGADNITVAVIKNG